MAARLGIAALAWLFCASMFLLSAQTQPAPEPFTKDDVVKLLNGNVPVRRVEALARERGIDFQITPETESELRKAGATDPLLDTLRELAPKPPTLVVITTPGGAQVFVDDELIARTSADGRLKISTLAPGPHKLRVSADGYSDHEESIDLAAGKLLQVAAILKSNTQSNAPATSSTPGVSQGESSPVQQPTAAAQDKKKDRSKDACSSPNPASLCNADNTCGSASAPCTVDIRRTSYSSSATPSIPGAKGNDLFCVKTGTTVTWQSTSKGTGFLIDPGASSPFDPPGTFTGGSEKSVSTVAKTPGCITYRFVASAPNVIHGTSKVAQAQLIVVGGQ